MNDEFYAITTFYNPAKYKQRLLNYKRFRDYLGVKLLTVELAFENNQFMLSPEDADILIQVKSKSIMWQKERLINIGINHLPDGVKYVAWIDCDILFGWKGWSNEAISALEKYPLIQLFDQLYDLDRNEMLQNETTSMKKPSGYSYAYHYNFDSLANMVPETFNEFRYCACGIAWAGRLELIKKHKLYDAMILGSGDRMMAFASTGKFQDAINTVKLDVDRIDHYLKWAIPLFEDTKGRIGHLTGNVFHLWHGDLSNRGWMYRHKNLSDKGFNPERDLTLNEQNCWEWKSENLDLQQYVSGYFSDRREDG